MAKLAHLFLVISAAIFLTGSHPELGRSEEKPTPEESKARAELAKSFPGRIIFDSNRGNGFGIFITDASGEHFHVFSDTPAHEMYPDVSPDGKWIVFSRSDSLDKRATASIWLAPVSGGSEKKLADDATFPTFSSDGKAVYFERARQRVMKHDLAAGSETEVFPKTLVEWHRREIVKPRISPDGSKVAFISRVPKRWTAWYADIASGAATVVGKGCEPTWFDNGDRIAWISGKNTRERSGVSVFDVATKKAAILQDADAPRGHEYFPTLVAKNGFLLYSAARPGEHDPVTANYQLFVKDLASNRVTRVTFDEYTNRWPKLLPKQSS